MNWYKRLMDFALGHRPFTDHELLEMYADKDNWVQLTFGGRCHWVWAGSNIPPYELLQDHLNQEEPPTKQPGDIFYRIPPNGHINNCALANADEEGNCQVCDGKCPDRKKFGRPG